jgi:hypothetical protein
MSSWPHLDNIATKAPRSLVRVLLRLLPLAIVVGGVTAASAASLGLSPASFGSASAPVNSCDTSFTVSYTTTYNATIGKYQVTEAVVDNIDAEACAAQTLDVVVAGDEFVQLATGSATVTGTTAILVLSQPIDADAVRNIAVMISG